MFNNSNLCRACLIQNETFTYFLFNNVSVETYWFCTSIEIIRSDALPKALCDSCHELLVKLTQFKRTCIESQNTLLGLSSVKSETPLHNDIELIDVNSVDTKLEFNPDSVKNEDISDHANSEQLEEIDDTVENKIKMNKRVKRTSKTKHKKCEVKVEVVKKHFLFSCELCNRKFGHHDRFEAHKLEHEGKIVTIQCSCCDKTFATWSGLRRHRASAHTAQRAVALRCAVCGRVCKSRETLRQHRKTHMPRPMHVCHVCGKGFTTQYILTIHLDTHNENRERRFPCEQCGLKFFSRAMLCAHRSRRHSGRRYVCQRCQLPFTDKYNLAKHMRAHDGHKPHACALCGKAFSARSALAEHSRTHTGERPHACAHCPKRFSSRRTLADHTRTHTGERPHTCRVCSHAFAQRGTLGRHMKVHRKHAAHNN